MHEYKTHACFLIQDLAAVGSDLYPVELDLAAKTADVSRPQRAASLLAP